MRKAQLALAGIFVFFSFHAYAAGNIQDTVPRFDIRSFRVTGNTLIPADKLESLLSPYTGKGRDFGAVQEALEALENAYRSRGFTMVVVTLPEQEIENGIVNLKVTENRIGRIKIPTLLYFDATNIRRSLPWLREGEIPNLNAISRSLKLVNESPAKKINLQLLNSDRASEVDADIEVREERPWKIGVSADNTGDRQTGDIRLGLLLQHANLFNRDHLLTLQYITSPEKVDKVTIFSLGYRWPLYSLGSSVDLIGAYSNVDSGSISAAGMNMNVSGKGAILGLRYNQNLTRSGNYEHKLILGLDYRAYENNMDVQGTQMGYNVTVHPVSLSYTGTLMFGNKGNGSFYVTDAQNLPGGWGGHDADSDFDRARYGAQNGYNILRYGANLSYVISGDWQLRALINGQYTSNKLVSGEQYGLGGASSIRGFREREITNDHGYSGSAELYSPDLSRLFGINAVQSRVLLFYDAGHVSRNDPLPGEKASTDMAGFGPGLRITDGKRFSVSMDYGFVVNPPDGNTARWSGRWHLSGTVLF